MTPRNGLKELAGTVLLFSTPKWQTYASGPSPAPTSVLFTIFLPLRDHLMYSEQFSPVGKLNIRKYSFT